MKVMNSSYLETIDCGKSKCTDLEDLKCIRQAIHSTAGQHEFNRKIFEKVLDTVEKYSEALNTSLKNRKSAFARNPAGGFQAINSLTFLLVHKEEYEWTVSWFHLKFWKDTSERNECWTLLYVVLPLLHEDLGKYELQQPQGRDLPLPLSSLENLHPATLQSMSNLPYVKPRKYELSGPMQKECFERTQSTFGNAHPAHRRAMGNLVVVYGVKERIGGKSDIQMDHYDINDDEMIDLRCLTENAHEKGITCLAIYHPKVEEGKDQKGPPILLTGSLDGTVSCWDYATWSHVSRFKNNGGKITNLFVCEQYNGGRVPVINSSSLEEITDDHVAIRLTGNIDVIKTQQDVGRNRNDLGLLIGNMELHFSFYNLADSELKCEAHACADLCSTRMNEVLPRLEESAPDPVEEDDGHDDFTTETIDDGNPKTVVCFMSYRDDYGNFSSSDHLNSVESAHDVESIEVSSNNPSSDNYGTSVDEPIAQTRIDESDGGIVETVSNNSSGDTTAIFFQNSIVLTNQGQRYHAITKQMINEITATDSVEYRTVFDFAGGVLNLDGEERDYLLNTLWTDELIHTLCDYIRELKVFWNYIFVAIGNAIAYPYQPLIDRLVNCKSFLEIIIDLLSSTNNDPVIQTAQITAVSTACKFILSDQGDIPLQILTLIPHLLTLANRENIRAIGVEVPAYRSLCLIFARQKYRQEYANEFYNFLLLSEKGSIIPGLLKEFGYGLEGRVVPGTSFYPIAYNYALNLQALSSIPEIRPILIDRGVIPLLTKALSIQMVRSERETSLLWSRCVKSLHNLTNCRHFHQPLLRDGMISILTNVASRPYSSLFSTQPQSIGRSLVDQCSVDFMKMRKRAADIVLSLGIRWDVQRLFWLAGRKAQSQNCYLQRLPDELIRMILKWLVLLGGVSDARTYDLSPVNLGFKF